MTGSLKGKAKQGCLRPPRPAWRQSTFNPTTPMSTKLFVGNIDYSVSENDLQDLFGQAGVVVSVNIIQDRMTGKSRGFGFVEMSSPDEAKKAIELVHQKEFHGRQLSVNEA